MTWGILVHLSVFFEVLKALLGPEPNPPPNPFSQSQRLQPGAIMSSKEMLPPLSSTPTSNNDQAETGVVQLR